MSRPRIAHTHLGVYADRMYGSDILCSRELLSRGQSELHPSSSSSEDFWGTFDGTPTGHTPFVLPRLATGSFEPLDLRIFGIFCLSRRSSHNNPS